MGKGKALLVHRLVARTFLGKPPSPMHCEVNHVDGNPKNNDVGNLTYVTRSEDIRHSYATNKSRKSCAHKQSKPVLGRQVGTDTWEHFPSLTEAARQLSLNAGNISKCCAKQQKATKGYEFQYAK